MSRSRMASEERGSALILALAFMVAMGLIILALATFTSDAILNTSNARSQRTSLNDAESATVTAMQYLRSNFVALSLYNGGQLPVGQSTQSCLPNDESASALPSSDPRQTGQPNSVSLACVPNYNPGSTATRVVDFYASRSGTSYTPCTTPGSSQVILHARVTYDDYATDGTVSCDPTSVTTCGSGMTVDAWDVATADS
jgi:Tfp pilus assembly protein PilX